MPTPPSQRFRVVPAAYVLFRRDTSVLLQLRQNTGYMDEYWATAAAGHVELGETVFAAACREVREELGVELADTDLRPLTAMHRTQSDHAPIDERVDFFFEARHWTGEPRLVETQKAAELRWFPLDALPDPVVAHERFVLDHLRAGAVPTITAFGF